nr:unnamed protein product [Spirometra erinaceieuropaei]
MALTRALSRQFRSSTSHGLQAYVPYSNANENFDRLLSQAFHAAADISFKYQLVAGDFNLPEVRWSPPSGPRRFDDFLEAVDVGMWTQAFAVDRINIHLCGRRTRKASRKRRLIACDTLRCLPTVPIGGYQSKHETGEANSHGVL